MFSLYLYICIYSYLHRNSRSQIFSKIGVLKNFVNFTGKHLQMPEARNFIKKRLQYSLFFLFFFFCEIFKNTFLLEHFGWLLLFTLPYLHLLVYTYLPLHIYYLYLSYMFSLYYYMNLIKYGEYRNYDEVFLILKIII